jgi:hypothetical protein
VADAFGGRSVSAGEFSGDVALDTDEKLTTAAAALRANADRLAAHGLLVALESFPWSAITNTSIAVDLLRRADAPNAGLLIDVWHFFNGGGRLDQLNDLPTAGITAVQLNDGPLVHQDFLQHARAQRQLPGHGELDVVGLIRAVHSTGYTGPYCVEANTPDFRNLPVGEAARRAADTATAALRAAAAFPNRVPGREFWAVAGLENRHSDHESPQGSCHSDRGPRGGNGHAPSTTTNAAFGLVPACSHVGRDRPRSRPALLPRVSGVTRQLVTPDGALEASQWALVAARAATRTPGAVKQ